MKKFYQISAILMLTGLMFLSNYFISVNDRLARTEKQTRADLVDSVFNDGLLATGLYVTFSNCDLSIGDYDSLVADMDNEELLLTGIFNTAKEDEEVEDATLDEEAEDATLVEETENVEETEHDASVSINDAEYVATLIESEAGNVKSQNGRVSIALTVFQRMESDIYPGSLEAVVEQPYQYADLVDYYSEESYQAAIDAIRLWEEGEDTTVLPEGYMYFFGYNQQNWFYRLSDSGEVEFYALPGQTITEDVIRAYRKIVLNEATV